MPKIPKIGRKFLRRHQRLQVYDNTLDLTVLLDIVFILLIFFILTANVAQNVFDLTLPKADENYKEEESLANKGTIIKLTLFTNGEYAIGDNRLSDYSTFKNQILAKYEKNKAVEFLVIPENTLPVEKLMELLTFFKSHNIAKIDILLKNK